MSDDPLGRRLAATDVDDEANDQVGEVEAAVESVSEVAEVAISVLGVAEGLVSARQHRLEVAQDGVDPFELRQVPGFALTDDFDLQPASVTAAKQSKPSRSTVQPGLRLALARTGPLPAPLRGLQPQEPSA